MSKHEAVVVDIQLLPHGNADSLSIVKIHDFSCVVRTEDWKEKTKAVYVEPDTLVNCTLPQFDFLIKDAKYTKESETPGCFTRIKAKKLRGICSYGLLIPVEDDVPVGTDYYETWDMGHYEPKPQSGSAKFGFVTSGEVASAPPKHTNLPKYDVESGMKWARKIFEEGEIVIGTLKYHGSSGSWGYSDNEFFARSRTEFKKEFASPPKANKEKLIQELGEERGLEVFNKIEEKGQNWNPGQNLWWRVLRENEELQKFTRDNPDTVVFGEVIGVQGVNFLYGLKPGQVSYRVFDIMKDGKWLNYQEARNLAPNLKWVKTLYRIPYNVEEMIKLSEEMDVHENIGGYEEGVCWGGETERWNEYTGRNKIKFISRKYSEKS